MNLLKTPLRSGAFLLAASTVMMAAEIAPANAQGVSEFFSSLQGDFRGRGKAIPEGGSKPVSISCRLSNNYSSGGGKLDVSGSCASTQGKTDVQGSMKHNGNRVSGAFISPFTEMTLTSSKGTYADGKLDVISSFTVNQTGELRRLRQVIKKSASGFRADFYSYENATRKYKAVGSIQFNKR